MLPAGATPANAVSIDYGKELNLLLIQLIQDFVASWKRHADDKLSDW
jgi:hypothetical protein